MTAVASRTRAPEAARAVESLISARIFRSPQAVGDRLYFVGNLGGHLSLYVMDRTGSVPEPLLPPRIALQNPELLDGEPFRVFPRLGKILVMLDADGDENYQPMLIPIAGGFPEPAFGERLRRYRVHCQRCDGERALVYLAAETRGERLQVTFRGSLETGDLEEIARGEFGYGVAGTSPDHERVALITGYSSGDSVLYLWQRGLGVPPTLLYGKPLEARAPGEEPPLNGIFAACFTPRGTGLLVASAVHEDTYGVGLLDLARPQQVEPVAIAGTSHRGIGELKDVEPVIDGGDRFRLAYNVDGASWVYEATFDEAARRLTVDAVICGAAGELRDGVVAGLHFDKETDRYALGFSTATSPTQLHVVSGRDRRTVARPTRERVLGVAEDLLARGEDASFTSYDGLRISARLYLPAPALGFEGPRPVVLYVHGGPHSQERPNFAWFSIPLIQLLALQGFAVFVPNVRGSSGYGLSYMKQVDRDWGGRDRQDHVHALTVALPKDPRLDVRRAGVVGRSYGGYMSLTLAGRHPALWKAAVDMFGPYDLLTFGERIPETWKPYFERALGHPGRDRDFLVERSPRTHLHALACPLLVIQGRNDPRVVERESADLVAHLRSIGKQVEYIVFENEGHDVLKLENRVRCYSAIADFFRRTLEP